MKYENITIKDPNLIKRYFHRRRFSDALRIFKNVLSTGLVHVLDYGGGDGELLRQMAAYPSIRATIYEPTPTLMAEAKRKLSDREWVSFSEEVTTLKDETYDFVFCLEVFEHLPEKETDQALGEIRRLIKPKGLAIIGVPIEIYFPAIFKGIFRMSRRYGEFDATPRNIFSATIGEPPQSRPIKEICSGFNYHFHHLGFDFRIFQHQMTKSFIIKKRWFSPFPFMGSILNSEVYFMGQKAQDF